MRPEDQTLPTTGQTTGPRLLAVATGLDELTEGVDLQAVSNPLAEATLGDLGIGAELRGGRGLEGAFGEKNAAAESLLILPIGPQTLAGLDADTVRVFEVDDKSGEYRPIWNSGVNREMGFIWAKVHKDGVYVPLGLPRDPLLQEALRRFSRKRRLSDLEDDGAVQKLFAEEVGPFLEEDGNLEEARKLVTRLEWKVRASQLAPDEIRFGTGGHPEAFPLPGDADPDQFRERLRNLKITARGLPEEVLFDPPDIVIRDDEVVPFNAGRLDPRPKLLDQGVIERLFPDGLPVVACLLSRDWWMYQGDREHTGRAKGCSNIRSTTVGRMSLHRRVPVDGPINTIPAVVDGKVYVGSTRYDEVGGTFYKIDLYSGAVEATFTPTGTAAYSISGIGGSPAVVGGRVYLSTVYGRIYCLDAGTLSQLWMQDLKVASALRRQPINNPDGDSWASPLVVDGKVYVASGEGEYPIPFGFVWCLDAATGYVMWVFCTSKFVDPNSPGNENSPNVIPRSAAISDPLPAWATAAGFSLSADPPHRGAAPWSSCAYDRVLNRVYIGTGNSRPDTPLPDERYASGVIALDADTGEFRGFHQSEQSDSYRPNDWDVDVPCPPTTFERDGNRVMAYGSKNGSFFLIDADTMQVLPNGRRQLLPKDENTGGRIHTVDPTGFNVADQDNWSSENKWGVMASAAVDRGRGHIYVGLGGYSGIDDPNVTPFVRALDWNDLSDVWPTSVSSVTTGGRTYSVRKYSNATPPVYTSEEAGLGSPATVNDVVFMPTSKVGLYALDAATGLCLWSAVGLPSGGWPNYCMGPAIFGDYVVVGAGDDVYIYRLVTRAKFPPLVWERRPFPIPEPQPWDPFPPRPFPGPHPDPPPWFDAAVREAVRRELGGG
jgi:outer membrane protein assembly factor BamB